MDKKLKKETAQENNSRAVKLKTINQMRIEYGLKPIKDGDVVMVKKITMERAKSKK